MSTSLAFFVVISFVFIIIFILISKNDLGVTSLRNTAESNETLLGKIGTGFPGSNILETSMDPTQREEGEAKVNIKEEISQNKME